MTLASRFMTNALSGDAALGRASREPWPQEHRSEHDGGQEKLRRQETDSAKEVHHVCLEPREEEQTVCGSAPTRADEQPPRERTDGCRGQEAPCDAEVDVTLGKNPGRVGGPP